uniref:Uncharacterized protein n=1 Tax=Ornithorhynchus anatinus TaxID=9258 RepID=A0A6I8NSB9_ORNAN
MVQDSCTQPLCFGELRPCHVVPCSSESATCGLGLARGPLGHGSQLLLYKMN